MPRPKRNFKVPPMEWVECLETHDEELSRVRMLWRRGGGDYRPLVPSEGQVAGDGGETDWTASELSEAHFHWAITEDQSPVERREEIAGTVEQLWEVASEWTRSVGGWCDFKLIGYNSRNHVLFEDGKRCAIEGWCASSGDEDGPDTDNIEQFEFSSRRRDQDRRLEDRMNGLLDRLTSERDKLFETADRTLATAQKSFLSVQESIEAAPTLLGKASEVFKEAHEYHREVVDQLRDERSGRIEIHARAYESMEKTKRRQSFFTLLTHVWDSASGQAAPLAQEFIRVFGQRDIMVFPQFKSSQQAMAYLVESLTPRQLRLMFEREQSAGAFIGLLAKGAETEVERKALECMQRCVSVLRSEDFHDIADASQQLAARYIISRLATFRMVFYGEPQEEDDESTRS